MKGLDFPIDIGEGVLKESCDVLEGSPFLGHVSRLPCRKKELIEVSISLLSQ